IYKEMIASLRESGIRVLLDADGELFKEGIQAKPYAIKPNRFELAQYFGVREPESLEDTVMLGEKLLNDQTRLVVISMGGEGALFLSEEAFLYCPVLPIDLKSSVGAGDAMVAAMALGLENKLSLEELAILCMATSAGACTTEGTQPARLEVIEDLKDLVQIERMRG
ncbi:1-phosphofructokinase family hexose kinase, partial [Dubosiella newyorkensis]